MVLACSFEFEQVTVKSHRGSPTLSPSHRPPSRNAYANISRPPSPLKSQLAVRPPLASSAVIRPKAKVNSSATTRKTPSVIYTAGKSDVSVTPRPRSPFKPPPVQTRSRPPSPSRSTLSVTRPAVPLATAHSTPSTPDRRHYALSPSSPDDALAKRGKTRHGSISLHHAVSLSSFHTRTPSTSRATPSIFARDVNNVCQDGLTQGKVKAKVSAMVQQAEKSNAHPAQPRAGPPLGSVSSNVSPNGSPPVPPNPVFYPITTATPAANPYRLATTRTSPSYGRYHYQPFSPHDEPPPTNHKTSSVVAKVDPAAIPPPLYSPPNAAVSFSSRSSVSRSSPSYRTDNSGGSQSSPRTLSSPAFQPEDSDKHVGMYSLDEELATRETNFTSQSRMQFGHPEDDEAQQSSEDRKVKAAAKSNRKVPLFPNTSAFSFVVLKYSLLTHLRLRIWKSQIALFSP